MTDRNGDGGAARPQTPAEKEAAFQSTLKRAIDKGKDRVEETLRQAQRDAAENAAEDRRARWAAKSIGGKVAYVVGYVFVCGVFAVGLAGVVALLGPACRAFFSLLGA